MIPRALLSLSLSVLAACGGDDSNKPAPSPSQPQGTQPPAATGPTVKPPSADAVTFTVEGRDDMKFSVERIEVKAGQKVHITMKNAGQLPKAAMGHNFVVLRKGVGIEDIQELVLPPKGTLENDYLPEEARKHVLAATRILGPGESESIEFTAPGLPCELVYVCTFTGHLATMNGKIIVQ